MGRLVAQGAQIGQLHPGQHAEQDLGPQGSDEQHPGDAGGIEDDVEHEVLDPLFRIGRGIGRQGPLDLLRSRAA